jgi:hypothetical protein
MRGWILQDMNFQLVYYFHLRMLLESNNTFQDILYFTNKIIYKYFYAIFDKVFQFCTKATIKSKNIFLNYYMILFRSCLPTIAIISTMSSFILK